MIRATTSVPSVQPFFPRANNPHSVDLNYTRAKHSRLCDSIWRPERTCGIGHEASVRPLPKTAPWLAIEWEQGLEGNQVAVLLQDLDHLVDRRVLLVDIRKGKAGEVGSPSRGSGQPGDETELQDLESW